MARVVALIPDLLFGSRVQAALQAAGHEVEMAGSREQAAERVHAAEAGVLIVDLTDDALGGPELVETLHGPRTLGFYSHVDTATRERAQQAGFDVVVPRSRMAREGAALVERLAQSG